MLLFTIIFFNYKMKKLLAEFFKVLGNVKFILESKNIPRLNKQLNSLLKKVISKQKYCFFNDNPLVNASIFSSFLINYKEIYKFNISYMILIFLDVLMVQFCFVSP